LSNVVTLADFPDYRLCFVVIYPYHLLNIQTLGLAFFVHVFYKLLFAQHAKRKIGYLMRSRMYIFIVAAVLIRFTILQIPALTGF
jgi:hypothetical protein